MKKIFLLAFTEIASNRAFHEKHSEKGYFCWRVAWRFMSRLFCVRRSGLCQANSFRHKVDMAGESETITMRKLVILASLVRAIMEVQWLRRLDFSPPVEAGDFLRVRLQL